MKKSAANNSIGNLLIQISKMRKNKSNALLADIGLHSGQDALLYYLSQEDGQTVSALVEKLSIRHATISSMINRMEIAGMIRKEKDISDKRTSRVFITAKGEKAFAKIAGIWKTMETLTVKGLTKKQEDQLRQLLQHVFKNLE